MDAIFLCVHYSNWQDFLKTAKQTLCVSSEKWAKKMKKLGFGADNTAIWPFLKQFMFGSSIQIRMKNNFPGILVKPVSL